MVKLPGQLLAYQEVSIYPKVNGYVKDVYVDIGSEVHHGQLLMVLEAPEIVQAVAQAREKYAQAKAGYSIDREIFAPSVRCIIDCRRCVAAGSFFSQVKDEADSSLANAEKSNWQIQQTMQEYLKVVSPFDGIITERNVFPGELVNTASEGLSHA